MGIFWAAKPPKKYPKTIYPFIKLLTQGSNRRCEAAACCTCP